MKKEKFKNKSKAVKNDENFFGRTNIPDYGVPAGVQLTENINEEIAEAVDKETPEMAPEK